MQRIISLCRKELSQFKRDRLTLALAFLLPLMTLIIFGFAIRLEIKNVPLFVRDFDNSYLSRTYTKSLFANNSFKPVNRFSLPPASSIEKQSTKIPNPQELIDRGIAQAAVIIPLDFSSQIKSGSPSNVQVLVDATDVNNARLIKNIIQITTKSFLHNSGLQTSTDKITANVRLLSNPERKEALFIVPGVYALVLWIYPSLLASISMVREKERSTILQVYASSLSAEEMLLGKGLAYLLIGIGEALFVMTLGSLIWGLSFAGEPTSLLIATLIFLADSVMFGLLIGIRTDNLNSTIQAVSLIGFLTAFLLSGFIYPLSNIPFPLSLLSHIVPARYYIEVTRDTFLRGTGWAGVWSSLVVLAILGLLLFNAVRLKLKHMQLSD